MKLVILKWTGRVNESKRSTFLLHELYDYKNHIQIHLQTYSF